MASSVPSKVEHIQFLCEQLTNSPKYCTPQQLVSESDCRLQSELKQLCHEVILVEPTLALEASIPRLLWNGLVRTTVLAYQNLKPRTTRALTQADRSLLRFVDAEIESLSMLVFAFPNVAAFPVSPTSELVGNLLWFLADLHCIKGSRVLDWSWGEAEHYYTRACWFLPGNGRLLNELGSLHQRNGSALVAIYFRVRAIGAECPHVGAKDDLASLWKHLNKRSILPMLQEDKSSSDPEVVLELLAAHVFVYLGAPKRKLKPISTQEVDQSRKVAMAFASHLQSFDVSFLPRCLWLHLATICIFLLDETSTLAHPEMLLSTALCILKSLAASVKAGGILGMEAFYVVLAWLCREARTEMQHKALEMQNEIWSVFTSAFSTVQQQLQASAAEPCQSVALPIEHDFCGFLGLFRESISMPSNTDAVESQKHILVWKIARCMQKHCILTKACSLQVPPIDIEASRRDDAGDGDDGMPTDEEAPSTDGAASRRDNSDDGHDGMPTDEETQSATLSDAQDSRGASKPSTQSIEDDRSSKRTKTSSSHTDRPPTWDEKSDNVCDGGSSSWIRSPFPGGYREG